MKKLHSLHHLFLGAVASCSLLLGATANAQVVPSDTFNIAVTGFNSSGAGAFLVGPLTATFGPGSQNFAGAGLGGQTVTVTTSESSGGGFTTTTITISVPTNFDPMGTMIGGMVVSTIQMEISNNAGTNRLDFMNPLITPTYTGSAIFGANQTIALNPSVTLTNGNRSLAEVEGLGAGGADLAPFAVRSFTFSARYATPSAVPDSGTTIVLLSVALGGIVLFRRRFAAA